MERYFNIGGPCLPTDHYMLSAMARLPQVVSLIGKKQYFVVHAQRQCGKTTAFLSLANEMNAKGEAVAVYCSLEAVQEFPKAEDGVPKIYELIRSAALDLVSADACPALGNAVGVIDPSEMVSTGIRSLLSAVSVACGKKPLVVFDPKLGDWDAKLRHEDVVREGKTVPVFFC